MSHDTTASRGRVLPATLQKMKGRERIAMVTAYDAPSARLADAAGMDAILVGDSAAMTVLGYESTLPVSMEEMLMLTRAVARGRTRALLVADMPFGSFQVSDSGALENAVRLVKDGGADAVKLEGAGATLPRIEAVVGAGIAVMGHIGLTPQSAISLGGYRTQGRTAADARALYEQALDLERVGCFSIVLEAMSAEVAAYITARVSIPTIGIGAGAGCDGQVLVWHDLLGLSAGHVPRFVKQYAALSQPIASALETYVADVRTGTFPEPAHCYPMPVRERELFDAQVIESAK